MVARSPTGAVRGARRRARLKVLIVGAGIVGLCVAWHLVRRGAQVTLLEREGPGLGCSYGITVRRADTSAENARFLEIR